MSGVAGPGSTCVHVTRLYSSFSSKVSDLHDRSVPGQDYGSSRSLSNWLGLYLGFKGDGTGNRRDTPTPDYPGKKVWKPAVSTRLVPV